MSRLGYVRGGTYIVFNGNSSHDRTCCSNHSPGIYNLTNKSKCEMRPQGTFSLNTTYCQPCPMGTYGNDGKKSERGVHEDWSNGLPRFTRKPDAKRVVMVILQVTHQNAKIGLRALWEPTSSSMEIHPTTAHAAIVNVQCLATQPTK